MAHGQVVKLNEDEAATIDRMFGRTSRSLEDFCRSYASEFGWESACITRGEKGCAMLVNREYVEAPGYCVQAQDTVGAGDAFAAAFIHGLSLKWPAARNRGLCQSRRGPGGQQAGRHPALDNRGSARSLSVTRALAAAGVKHVLRTPC